MSISTSTQGAKNLPRYFSAVFQLAQKLVAGQIDFLLPDGRLFLAVGQKSGPKAHLNIHNSDVFARLIREGDLGFCDAYLDAWW